MKLRRLAALMLFMCAATILISSTMLYVGPQWHVAYWTGWTLLGAQKDQWMSVHINFGILMLMTAMVHIYLNWAQITTYVKRGARQLLVPSRELAVALIVTLTLLVGSLNRLAPIQWTIDWHLGFQTRVAERYGAPPLPFMEQFPLEVVAQRLNFDLEKALERVGAAGYKLDGTEATILDIAIANGVTSQTIYGAMQAQDPDAGLPGGS